MFKIPLQCLVTMLLNYGGAIYTYNGSHIMFKENSSPMFSNNDGAAIYSVHCCYISFEGNSSPVFSNNIAGQDAGNGGAIYTYNSSVIMFTGNSSSVFSNNSANYGAAIYSEYYSNISFEENSSPVFSNNVAGYGGAIYTYNGSHIMFKGYSSPMFSNNDGGAIYSEYYSYITFEGNSSPVFSNNIASWNAGYDGAIRSYNGSHIMFKGNSSPVFSNNSADYGGAIYSYNGSHIMFTGNSSAVFDNNTVTNKGGAIYTSGSNISFEGFSSVIFSNNIAEYGGAVFTKDQSDIIFSDYSTVTFTNNSAAFGATAFSNINSKIIATGNSTIIFNDSSPNWCNSICLPYTGQTDVVTIDSNGTVWCSDQKAFVCVSKECDCDKLEDLLDGLENNTLVNITNTVTLSSVIVLGDLNNISIIGYNNITVNCVDGGGLKLRFCSDIIIEGISWIRCGNYNNTNDVPVIHLIINHSNTTIQKCTFQYSLGKAISLDQELIIVDHVLSNTLNIDNCNFMNNNRYRGHGATIFISINNEINVNVSHCTFHYNGEAESIIYFDFRFPDYYWGLAYIYI